MLVEKPRHESEIHYFIKQKVGQALEELGFSVELEKRVQHGRIDVHAIKADNEINVEIMKSNAPEWVLLKVKGDLKRKPRNEKSGFFAIPSDYASALKEYARHEGRTYGTQLKYILIDDMKFQAFYVKQEEFA